MKKKPLFFLILCAFLISLPPYTRTLETGQTFLFVNDFSEDYAEWWLHSGTVPYLGNNSDFIQDKDYGSSPPDTTWYTNQYEHWDIYFDFEDLNVTYDVDAEVILQLYMYTEGAGGLENLVLPVINAGYGWITLYPQCGGNFSFGEEYHWHNWTLTNYVGGKNQLNFLKMQLVDLILFNNRDVVVRKAMLNVSYTEAWRDPAPPLEDYFPVGMGFFGMFGMMFLPLFLVMLYRRKKESFWEWIPWAICLFFIFIGCIIGWLWD